MPAPTVARKAFAVVKLALAIGVAGLLVAAILLPFVGGVGVAARNSVQAFDDQPCDVTPTTPAQASVIYASDGTTQLARFYSQNREIVPLSKISPIAQKAVVAIEDRRFYEHHGVDVQGTIRALIENSRSGGVVQGGSTLTQQYIKQVRLYSAKTVAEQRAAIATTTARKLIEAKCALTLEQHLTKQQILERYMNIAYFGSGAYGIQTAAKTYFNKQAAALTLPEAAMLAGIVQSPTRYDPHLDKKAAAARRNTVLDEMQSLGYITPKQAVQAKASPVVVKPRRSTSKDCLNANPTIPNDGFFCDYVKYYLTQIGYSQQRLESGGFKIVTTLDPTLQRRVQAAVYSDMPANLHATSVMDVLDNKTGMVRAMAVSKHYGINKKDSQQTSLGLGYEAVAGAGSTYKLFTLVAALQKKIPLEAFTINNTNEYKPTNCGQARGKGTVVNAGHYPTKPYTLDEATYASVNTFFVALLDQQFNCDLSMPVRDALNMGMNALKPEAERIIDGQQYSFTLGPQRTSPLELASAYATIANDGKYCPPTPIDRIVGPDGKALSLPERPCTQQIDPGIAHTIAQVLVKDTKPGFAGTANHRFVDYYSSGGSDIAGKTGTASAGDTGLNSSAWFIGFTPNITASVATFDPKSSSAPLADVPGYENQPGEIFGSFSAHIWNDALTQTLLDQPRWQFAPMDQAVVDGNSVPVPSVIGQDVATATQILAGLGFGIQVAPDRKDSGLPPDRIADQSPTGRGLPGQKITVYLSSGKPQATPQPGPGGGPPGHRRGGGPTPTPGPGPGG